MKRICCALLALLLAACPALAEGSIIENPQLIIQAVTSAPSPQPSGESFSSEDLVVTLPHGLSVLDEGERTGYDAAVQFDYPNAGQVVLAAVNEDASSALSFSILETDASAADAAREAAAVLLGEDSSVEEILLGENSFSALSYEYRKDAFRLYFLSNGSRLLCVGAAGLEEEAVHTMLAGLIF